MLGMRWSPRRPSSHARAHGIRAMGVRGGLTNTPRRRNRVCARTCTRAIYVHVHPSHAQFATVHGKGRHAEDPSEQVRDYVDRHDLLAVMEQSLAALLYSKPEDPKAFLSNYLGILKKAGRKETSFFTDDDLGIVFGLFDLTGKGVMAPKQFANALKNLGIERAPAIERPISKERFVQLARAALDAL